MLGLFLGLFNDFLTRVLKTKSQLRNLGFKQPVKSRLRGGRLLMYLRKPNEI